MPKNTITRRGPAVPRAPKPVVRTLIGHWHAGDDPTLSHPQPLVDHSWEMARRHQIVEYLRSAPVWGYCCGSSYCRFGCTRDCWIKSEDPSQGEYREVYSPYIVITDGHEEHLVRDESGYYLKQVKPMLNGHRAQCDDVWCWPEGLAHYVETHGIRLPDEFVAHAAARLFQRGSGGVWVTEDDRFWRKWCETNAPFSYEPHCLECTSPSPGPGR
jgi:hypothetical protein